MYVLQYSDRAIGEVDALKKAGDVASLTKLRKLLKELKEHPTTGTGKPERLKHDMLSRWSRRISQKNRMLYRVYDEDKVVFLFSIKGHYGDK